MCGHGLVHDHDEGGVRVIMDGKGSAIEQRDAHGTEVVAVGNRERGKLQLPTVYGRTLDRICTLCGKAGCGEDVGDASGEDSGLVREPIEDGAVEDVDGSIAGI